MSNWYTICGWVRVRKCAVVEHILGQLGDRFGEGIKIDVTAAEPDQLEISVEGGALFPKGYALGIEALLESLGPYSLEGAVFGGECDRQPWEIVIAPTEEAGRIALSQSRLEEIDGLVGDLTAADRARLIAQLQAS